MLINKRVWPEYAFSSPAYLYVLTESSFFYLALLNFLKAKVYLKEQIQLRHKRVQSYMTQRDFNPIAAFIGAVWNYWACPYRFLFPSACHLVSSQDTNGFYK